VGGNGYGPGLSILLDCPTAALADRSKVPAINILTKEFFMQFFSLVK
jgi:hypothetical protein